MQLYVSKKPEEIAIFPNDLAPDLLCQISKQETMRNLCNHASQSHTN